MELSTVAGAREVPCTGSGPWQFANHHLAAHLTYRDCSRPDLSRASSLPWIEKP